MAIADLLPMWLKESANDRRKRAREVERAYEQLQGKDTLYGRSIKALAEAHNTAADVGLPALLRQGVGAEDFALSGPLGPQGQAVLFRPASLAAATGLESSSTA